jgi:hypothetical protein
MLIQYFSSFLVIVENSKIASSISEEMPSFSDFSTLQYKRSQVLQLDEFLIKGKTRESLQTFSSTSVIGSSFRFVSIRRLFPESDYDFMVESTSVSGTSSSLNITDRFLSVLVNHHIRLILTSEDLPIDIKTLLLLKDIYYVRDSVPCCFIGDSLSWFFSFHSFTI